MKHLHLIALLIAGIISPHTTWSQYIDPAISNAYLSQNEVTYLVILKEKADITKAHLLQGKVAKSRYVFETLRKTYTQSQAPLIHFLKDHNTPYQAYYITNMVKVTSDISIFRQISKMQSIEQIVWDIPTPMQRVIENTNNQSREGAPEWGLLKIKADQAWDLGYKGKDIVIAGQDTGFDWLVSPLHQKYRGYTGDSIGQHNYNWHDAIRTPSPLHADSINPCGFDVKVPCDDHNHGTHTMGTMVGSDSMNSIGVAPEATWIACRNMDRGYGSPSTYTECFEWFLAPTDLDGNNPLPEKAPHVINNSWGCPEMEGCNPQNWQFMEEVVNNLRAAGIVVVVSAGNSGDNCNSIQNPAAIFDGSFTVGATRINDTIANFSSRGIVKVDSSYNIKPNIVAPGHNVRSVIRNGEYRNWSGTSMAGPHVAGAVALLIDAVPSLEGEVALIESILAQSSELQVTTQSCDGYGPLHIPNATYGYGRIDIIKAIGLAKETFQEFAPIGAKWSYEAQDFISPFNPPYVHHMECIGTAQVKDKVCKVIVQDGGTCNLLPDTSYIYQDLNRIYYYWPRSDSFYLLYDFNRSMGEAYDLPYIDWDFTTLTTTVQVDSVKSLNLDGYLTDAIYTRSNHITNVIVPRIGGLNFFYPHEEGLCDGPRLYFLRCYEDNEVYIKLVNENQDCAIISKSKDAQGTPWSIHPNPNDGTFIVSGPTIDTDLKIYNHLGQEVYSAKYHGDGQYQATTLQHGIYVIVIDKVALRLVIW